MLRITHRLLQINSPLWESSAEDSPLNRMRDRLASGETHSVVCDNVAEYVFDSDDKTKFDPDNLPGLAPPWRRMLLEWREPKNRTINIQQTAVAFLSVDLNEMPGEREVLLSIASGDSKLRLAHEAAAKCRWIVNANIFVVQDGVCDMLPASPMFYVNDDGSFVNMNYTTQCDDRWIPFATTAMLISFAAFSIANCKNVALVDSTAIDAPPAKWQRRMKTPEIRYSRIKIDGFTSEAKTQGGGIDGHNKAWHICRGNFATYTDAKPLFGKYTGRYWRPQHVKGDKKHGEVHSTHEVSPHDKAATDEV